MSPRHNSRPWFPPMALLLSLSASWIFVEGIYSLLEGPQAETSLAYSVYANFLAARDPGPADPLDANSTMLRSRREIDAMLPLMKQSGFGLGNSPYSQLKSDATAMNSDAGPCRVQKPGLHKIVGFLRGNLFNPFDQITFFYDDDRVPPPELEAFLERYAFRRIHHGSNAFGERLTLPPVEAPRKVLIAGDSVALGAMLDDSETLASQLQRRDGERQYVNLGIAGAKAADTVCALDRAASRYHGSIDELVYVLCENDWIDSEPYGKPDQLFDWLAGFVDREKIGTVTLVYVPYIYNTSPELVRLRGHMLYGFPTYAEQKHRAVERAKAAGYRVIDYLDVTNEARRQRGSQFASLAMYVDHAHPSREGVERLADVLDANEQRRRPRPATTRDEAAR